MDSAIQISKLNDFIFCPYSVYLHSIYDSFTQSVYHDVPQTTGKIVHAPIDKKAYSSRADMLQGISITSEKYGLVGKLDLFDIKTKTLIERKYYIKTIYDGYRYQLYAQYLCLLEMDYQVKHLCFHSLKDNKRYHLAIPSEQDLEPFFALIDKIRTFQPGDPFAVTIKKCQRCIYHPLCSYSLC